MVYTFALVILLFTPDLSGYKHLAGLFPDRAACEAVRAAKVKEADALGFRHAITCVKLAGGPGT